MYYGYQRGGRGRRREGGRLSAEAVARRDEGVASEGRAARLFLALPLSFHPQAGLQRSTSSLHFGSSLHSAAIQSIFGGRSRRMSFFSRKKHTQQQASTSVVAQSPASAALAQIQQPPTGQQQPQKQLSKETSYDRCVHSYPFRLLQCPSGSSKRIMDASLITFGSAV